MGLGSLVAPVVGTGVRAGAEAGAWWLAQTAIEKTTELLKNSDGIQNLPLINQFKGILGGKKVTASNLRRSTTNPETFSFTETDEDGNTRERIIDDRTAKWWGYKNKADADAQIAIKEAKLKDEKFTAKIEGILDTNRAEHRMLTREGWKVQKEIASEQVQGSIKNTNTVDRGTTTRQGMVNEGQDLIDRRGHHLLERTAQLNERTNEWNMRQSAYQQAMAHYDKEREIDALDYNVRRERHQGVGAGVTTALRGLAGLMG